jgi:hypothetical protein
VTLISGTRWTITGGCVAGLLTASVAVFTIDARQQPAAAPAASAHHAIVGRYCLSAITAA